MEKPNETTQDTLLRRLERLEQQVQAKDQELNSPRRQVEGADNLVIITDAPKPVPKEAVEKFLAAPPSGALFFTMGVSGMRKICLFPESQYWDETSRLHRSLEGLTITFNRWWGPGSDIEKYHGVMYCDLTRYARITITADDVTKYNLPPETTRIRQGDYELAQALGALQDPQWITRTREDLIPAARFMADIRDHYRKMWRDSEWAEANEKRLQEMILKEPGRIKLGPPTAASTAARER